MFSEKQYILWLANTGVTSSKLFNIIRTFGSAESFFMSNESGTKESKKQSLIRICKETEEGMFGYTTFFCPDYPPLLKNISDPPAIIYYSGDISCLQSPCVSIIGSRRSSEYGDAAAKILAHSLAAVGITIISGMANGVDSAAHEGAIESGMTAAVLGGGLNKIYPANNVRLMKKIISSGVVLSEHAPDAAPIPAYFSRRNRIISGISYATIVCEANEKSGTSGTVNFALEQGREVYAVPGSIFSPLSAGTNRLIRDGAPIVVNAGDILYNLSLAFPDVFHIKAVPKKEQSLTEPQNLGETELKIYNIVRSRTESVSADLICNKLDIPVEEVLVALTMLEVDGYIKQLPGSGYVCRKHSLN